MIILGTNSIKDTGYDVANSIRLGEHNHYLVRNKTTATNVEDFTISVWVKRAKLGTKNAIMSSWGGDSNNTGSVYFTSGDKLTFEAQTSGSYSANGGVRKITTQVFRDVSAWSHFVFKKDDGVFKIFHNGVEITDFDTDTESSGTNVFSTSTGNISIGIENLASAGHYFQGYIAETILVDGQALDPTSFGEFDEDSPTIWKPKDVSGLTFGNNGFYLDFEDASNLGNDASGGTDFTELNLAAIDQSTDTCTNNFATMNPLAAYYSASTFSEGNLKVVTGSSAYTYDISTIGVASGKWYWEFKYTAAGGDPHNVGHFGISGKGMPTANSHSLGYYSTDYGISADSGGTLYNNNSGTTNSLYNVAIGDIIAFALDLDSGTNTLKYYRNGTEKITINISSSPENGFYFPAFGFTYSAASGTFEANFGGTQSFSISSGNSDANGFGNFEYSVPSGYFSLCTKNLAEFG